MTRKIESMNFKEDQVQSVEGLESESKNEKSRLSGKIIRKLVLWGMV